MSASQVREAVERAFRDFVTHRVPATGANEPIKAEVRDALGRLLETTLASIGSGMLRYATTADRDAAVGIATGTVAYVYKNAGSEADAANGYYQKTASGWEPSTWLQDLFNLNPEQRAKADWGFITTDEVTYSGSTFPITATVQSEIPREDSEGFTGFGQTYETPAAIAFNAVFVPRIPRAPSVEDKWHRIDVVVRSHATDPAGVSATVVAVGSVEVSPDQDRIDFLLVPLRDPGTDALVTVDAGDLDARFGVAYIARGESGSATAGNCDGPVEGATRLTSYYTTDANDDVGSAWSPYSGNPSLAIGVALLTDLEQAPGYGASASLREALSLPPVPTVLRNPSPSMPIMTPRWYGMTGYPGSIYNHGLTSGLGLKLFDYDGGLGLGRHQDDRWYWDADLDIGANSDPLEISAIDPEHLAAFGSRTAYINVVAANAADGEARTLLCLGDSTTAAGKFTQRLLTRSAANTDGLQPTLVGTLGAGANRHEGRPGWTIGAYFETYERTDGGVPRRNPFVETDGDKFNASFYLSDNALSAPAVVSWHLSINDVFNCKSDGEANAVMAVALDQLERMIGVTPDAEVGSWKEASAGISTLICTPIAPGASQTGFGAGTGYVGQSYSRYKRNIAIAAARIIERFRDAEGDKIWLVPWHVTVNPVTGYAAEIDPIHPVDAGYDEMGDQLYYALNVLSAVGAI